MKKVTMIMLLAAVAMFWGTSAFAAISGACSGCHSMHNSQDGAALGFGEVGLLSAADCVSCHSGTNTGANSTPYVDDSTNPLAGGSFDFAVDSQVHNAVGTTAGADGTLVNTPPGGAALAAQLTCAGTNGCHGSRAGGEMADISGSHHANVDLTTLNQPGAADSAAVSYRFLKGVAGIEESGWEYAANTTTHNQLTSDATQGIGAFCANCHDAFHSAQGSAGAWTRHPTDVAVSGAGTGAYVNYDVDVPVGTATILDMTTNGLIDTGDVQTRGTVTCLSCHVAHGSANDDLLRWSGNTGCTTCHDAK